MTPPTDVRMALVTAPSEAEAERIGGALVEEGLAACANLVAGVTSIFRWEGRVQRESEVLIILKTTSSRVDELRDRVVELHPYQVPEVLVLEVATGHHPYLAWVASATGGAP